MRLFSEAPDQTRWIGVGAATSRQRSGHANESPDPAAVSEPPELLEEKDVSDLRPALEAGAGRCAGARRRRWRTRVCDRGGFATCGNRSLPRGQCARALSLWGRVV